MTGKCEYCRSPGARRVAKGEGGAAEDVFVCDPHWRVLQNPKTAIPFIRGVVTSRLRGKMLPTVLKRVVDSYIERLEKLRPKPDGRQSGPGA